MVDFNKGMKSMKGRIQADFTNSKQVPNGKVKQTEKGPTLFSLFLILKGGLYSTIQIILNILISFPLTFSDSKSITKLEEKELY